GVRGRARSRLVAPGTTLPIKVLSNSGSSAEGRSLRFAMVFAHLLRLPLPPIRCAPRLVRGMLKAQVSVSLCRRLVGQLRHANLADLAKPNLLYVNLNGRPLVLEIAPDDHSAIGLIAPVCGSGNVVQRRHRIIARVLFPIELLRMRHDPDMHPMVTRELPHPLENLPRVAGLGDPGRRRVLELVPRIHDEPTDAIPKHERLSPIKHRFNSPFRVVVRQDPRKVLADPPHPELQ